MVVILRLPEDVTEPAELTMVNAEPPEGEHWQGRERVGFVRTRTLSRAEEMTLTNVVHTIMAEQAQPR